MGRKAKVVDPAAVVEDKDTKTLAISMPTALHEHGDKFARENGLTYSSWALSVLVPAMNWQGDVPTPTKRYATEDLRKAAIKAENDEKSKYMKLIKSAMQRGINVEALLALEKSVEVTPPTS